jgi:hypothetical protein
MKYIKLYEDNGWEYTPEKLDEFINKYTILQTDIENDLKKAAFDICSLSVFDVYKDLDYYKKSLETLKKRKELAGKTQDEIWKIIDVYPSLSNNKVDKLEEIHSKIDWMTMEFDDLIELLEELLDFFKNISNKEILSKVLKGEFTKEI